MTTNDEHVESLFEGLGMDHVEAYVRQGRRFELLETAELTSKLLEATKNLSLGPMSLSLSTDRQDIEAEFLIRKESPVVDTGSDYDALREQVLRRFAEFEDELKSDLADKILDNWKKRIN